MLYIPVPKQYLRNYMAFLTNLMSYFESRTWYIKISCTKEEKLHSSLRIRKRREKQYISQ